MRHADGIQSLLSKNEEAMQIEMNLWKSFSILSQALQVEMTNVSRVILVLKWSALLIALVQKETSTGSGAYEACSV